MNKNTAYPSIFCDGYRDVDSPILISDGDETEYQTSHTLISKSPDSPDSKEDAEDPVVITERAISRARAAADAVRGPANFTIHLQVQTVIVSTLPVEYPPTALDGIAIIFPHFIDGERQDPWACIQYAKGKGQGEREVRCPFFSNLKFKKEMRNCNGVKVCELTKPDIRNSKHTSVDPDTAFLIESENAPSREQQTFTWFLALKRNHQQCRYEIEASYTNDDGIEIPPRLCDGKLLLRECNKMDDGRRSQHFVGCTEFRRYQWRENPPYHRFVRVPHFVDAGVLEELIKSESDNTTNYLLDSPKTYCSTVLPNNTGMKECAHTHKANGSVVMPKIVATVSNFSK